MPFSLTRSRDSGKQHRLCQSVRHGDPVRQVTLLNRGADFSVPRRRWAELPHLIETLDQQQPLFPPDPRLLEPAEEILQQLRQRRSNAVSPDDDPHALVRLDSLCHPPSTSVGAERVALAALEALQFPRLLRSVGLSERHASVATSLVMARMLQPASELAASRWLARRSAALELVGLDTNQPPSVNTLHRCGDRLWQRRAALEAGLTLRQQSLFPSRPRAVAC